MIQAPHKNVSRIPSSASLIRASAINSSIVASLQLADRNADDISIFR